MGQQIPLNGQILYYEFPLYFDINGPLYYIYTIFMCNLYILLSF